MTAQRAAFLAGTFAALAPAAKAASAPNAMVKQRSRPPPLTMVSSSTFPEAPDAAATRVPPEAGTDPNSRMHHGRTPQMLAVRENEDPAIIRLLLEHGAGPAARDEPDRTAWAIISGRISANGIAALPAETRQVLTEPKTGSGE